MPTTGVDILNIKTDSDIGLGSDSNIPVPAVALDQINKANDDIRLYDLQMNVMKYQQKIKDRDTLLQGLSADQVAVGAILPEDKHYFDEAESKYRKAYLSVKTLEPDKNGQNKEYEAAMAAKQDLKDMAALTQSRYVEIQKLRKARAEMVLPKEQAEMDKFIAKQIAKPVGEPIEPYQKTFNFGFDKLKVYLEGSVTVGGQPTPELATTKTDKVTTTAKGTTAVQTTVTKPVTGKATGKSKTPATAQPTDTRYVVQEPDQVVDYGSVLRKATQDYIEQKEGGLNQKQIYNAINGHNIQEPAIKNWIDQKNKKLALYDQQNGTETIKITDPRSGPPSGVPGDTVGTVIDSGMYPTELNYEVMGDGTIVLKDQIPELAAKIALADYDGDYVVKGKKYFDEAAYKRDWEAKKDNADILLKGAKAQTEGKKGQWYLAKIRGMNADKEKEKAINDGYKYNIITQDKLVDDSGTALNIPANKTTPIFTWGAEKQGSPAKPIIIKPIGAKEIRGTDINDANTYGQIIGYEGGYYGQQYESGGKILDKGAITDLYGKFKTKYPDLLTKYEVKTIDDFVKLQIELDEINVKIIGENGSTNRNVHTQALKAISNTNSKKGQEQPFYETDNEE